MRKTKTARLGDYVLVTKFSDRMYGDPWAIGFICKIEARIVFGNMSEPEYTVCHSLTGEILSGYPMKNVWKLTKEEGENILEYERMGVSGYQKIRGTA